MRATIACPIVLAVLMGAASASAAQQESTTPNDHRWSAFLGCWQPDTRAAGPQSSLQRCIVPGSRENEVRIGTYSGDSLVVDETVVADGRPQPMQDKECTGERTTRWSTSGARLFYRTTSTCASRTATTSGISALVSERQWLDIQAASTDGREQVRVVRYYRSASTPPAPVADALRRLAVTRVTLARVSVDDVIEASAQVDSAALEAWLAESTVRLPLNRRALIRLDAAHVHPRVIDLLVALAFPQWFEVRAARSGGSTSVGSMLYDDPWLGRSYEFSPGGFGWSIAPFYFSWSPFYPYSAYELSPGATPIEPSGGGSSASGSHGYVVNGQGYTRVQPKEAVPPASRVNSDGSPFGGGAGADSAGSGGNSTGSGGSSGGASPAGYSGGGGASTGLTAVPR